MDLITYNKSLLPKGSEGTTQMELISYSNTGKLDPYWITGFTQGDGCFTLNKWQRNNIAQFGPRFVIAQHSRDLPLMQNIKNYFGVGIISKIYKNYEVYYRVTGKDLLNIIIPHFIKYPLKGTKLLDLIDFKTGVKNL